MANFRSDAPFGGRNNWKLGYGDVTTDDCIPLGRGYLEPTTNYNGVIVNVVKLVELHSKITVRLPGRSEYLKSTM